MRTIDNINDLNKSDFLSVFGNVFEKTESVAMEAFNLKPFKNFEDIVFKMLDIYENYEKDKILEILNAHHNKNRSCIRSRPVCYRGGG